MDVEPTAQSPTPALAAPGADPSLRKRTVAGSLWTLLGTVAGAPVILVSTVLSARLLGATDFGRLALLLFATSLTSSLADLGLTTVLQRRVALELGRRGKRNELLVAQQVLPVTAFRMLSLVCVSAVLLSNRLGVILVVLSAIAQIALSAPAVLLTGTSRGYVIAKTGFASNVIGYATMVVVAGATRNTDITVGAFLLAANVPHLALLWMTEFRARDLLRPRMIRVSRQDWRFALFQLADGQLSTLLFSRSELMFFPSSRGTERGAFAAATTVGARITLLLDSLFGPVPFALATMHERGSTHYRSALSRLFRLAGALFVLSFPTLASLSVVIGPLLFPPEFGDLRMAILVLVGTSLIQTAGQPALAAWVAEGRAGPMLMASAAAGALDLGASAILVPRFGLVGAVSCNVFGAVIYLVWLFVAFRGHIPASEYVRYLAAVTLSTTWGLLLGAAVIVIPASVVFTGPLVVVIAIASGVLAVRGLGLLQESDLSLLAASRLGRVLPRYARLLVVRERTAS